SSQRPGESHTRRGVLAHGEISHRGALCRGDYGDCAVVRVSAVSFDFGRGAAAPFVGAAAAGYEFGGDGGAADAIREPGRHGAGEEGEFAAVGERGLSNDTGYRRPDSGGGKQRGAHAIRRRHAVHGEERGVCDGGGKHRLAKPAERGGSASTFRAGGPGDGAVGRPTVEGRGFVCA